MLSLKSIKQDSKFNVLPAKKIESFHRELVNFSHVLYEVDMDSKIEIEKEAMDYIHEKLKKGKTDTFLYQNEEYTLYGGYIAKVRQTPPDAK